VDIPAFPIKEPLSSDNCGMSLRDYFAAKAMQSLFTYEDVRLKTYEHVADFSYKLADAMLAERSKHKGGDA